jgi:hypothetical protein
LFHIQYQPVSKVTLLRLVFKSNLVISPQKSIKSRMPVHLARSGCVHPHFGHKWAVSAISAPQDSHSWRNFLCARFFRTRVRVPSPDEHPSAPSRDPGGTIVEEASAPSPTTAMAAP